MTHRNWLLTTTLATIVLIIQGCSGGGPEQQQTAGSAPASEAPRVYIASPQNGEVVVSPVTVKFGIDNFQLAPAGTFDPDTGHHHLLIDTKLPALDQPIPSDENHLHFGKAQTETTLELAPGTHTLQLVLGDGAHVPHDTALISEVITITVE